MMPSLEDRVEELERDNKINSWVILSLALAMVALVAM